MNTRNLPLSLLLVSALLGLGACDGDDGADGPPGPPGPVGPPGQPGLPAGSFTTTAESASDVTLSLAPADIVVVGSEPFALTFQAMGTSSSGEMVPFVGLSRIAVYVLNESARMDDMGAPMQWQSHTQANGAGSSMECTLTGMTSSDGMACTLVEDAENPGTYTGSWTHEGNAPVVLADGDPNNLHRVVLRGYDIVDSMGQGVADKVLSTPLDFIPASGEEGMSMKDTVTNAACIQCHGMLDGYAEDDMRFAYISAHRNYQKVEQCVACHTPALGMADFAPMVHGIHSGVREGYETVGYPAEIYQCLHCHGEGDSWEANVWGMACESCHTSAAEHIANVGNDASCVNCHGVDSVPGTGVPGPVAMSHVPTRRMDLMTNQALKLTIESAEVTAAPTEGVSTLTVTTDVVFNGAPAPDDFDFTPYMTNANRGLLIGNVDANGFVTRSTMGMNIQTDRVSLTGGKLVTAREISDTLLTGTLYLTAEVQYCGDKMMAALCGETSDGVGYANEANILYVNLDGGEPVMARHSMPERVSVTVESCNSCHENLTHVKGTHGATEFTQCMACHNSTWGGSFHPTVNLVNSDGSGFTTLEGLTYSNRDLVTVVHRYHSGVWDNEAIGGVYLDENQALNGYPSGISSCRECHTEGASLFAADGGLLSGKRAISVVEGMQYISPVAESCRSCHAHSSAAALAHFSSNGATIESDMATTPDLPVESCATCHAEGKSVGIDKVHNWQ
ncbi:OmcA/MtrC family decaheme c-type cytochrome [Ferrimonas balearica]|uniref:OmcA/MtrC family decaheme c-type cytochrome n=1 Tax=Ferrimonas balearica TaxID=44012 RepID=UPI001C996BFE|nr:OmcA/MtrC family decaheme c-type cytochrome [Ferrimonas balearica]MBY5990639.1 OmcA/MtrC family decaheme c-type cytochrome [Ferrimonas balearica]